MKSLFSLFVVFAAGLLALPNEDAYYEEETP
jgi:hypothetical protein